ncbi:MAG: hypothetical protein HQK88_11660 [Nitrospirae bacterium]|nr:hypothetical protein [Nitrospirota bacterium]MBF0535574.1 hypothetical protein [Nitrospirota bacterium]MBF0617457.1 hypothetical protein [Nitrospirota bacterium]
MIAEFLTYLTTPAPLYVKRMGYLKEAIAIEARYKRCKAAWSPHLENSKNFIINALKRCKAFRTVVVLGSGNLLDLPLLQLSQTFEKVILVDIVHLGKILKTIRKFTNVVSHSCDITETSEIIFNLIKNRTNTTEHIELPMPKMFHLPETQGNCTDLVISLNIFSQLTVMPREYILKNKASEDGTVLKRWENEVLEAHLDALMALKTNVCLITDFEFIERNHRTQSLNQYYTLTGINLPLPEKTWTWNIAPKGEISNDISIERKVAAFFFNPDKQITSVHHKNIL